MNLFDSHCHYNDEKFDIDRKEIIMQNFEKGVKKAVVAGYSLKSSEFAIEIANKYEHLYATAGISPNDLEEIDLEKIEKLAQNKKVVAIGEIGLDYHYTTENKELQKQLFIKQIEIANKLNLPIVIHTREAVMDTLQILKEYPVNKKGVFHCCPLNIELIKEGLKLGFYISFSGNVTFKNAKNAGICIEAVPLDKILIETDSPYMTPEPHRGERNTPANVKYVAEKIAEIKDITAEEVAKQTFQNAERIFGIE